MKKYFLFLLLFSGIYQKSFATEFFGEDWIKIAEKTVSFKADKDVITPQGAERKVDKIKIKCTQGTIQLIKVSVEMSNGNKKEYNAKGTGLITNGMSSLAFDLPGKDLSLKKVTLEYDTKGNIAISKKAHIELLGRSIK